MQNTFMDGVQPITKIVLMYSLYLMQNRDQLRQPCQCEEWNMNRTLNAISTLDAIILLVIIGKSCSARSKSVHIKLAVCSQYE